MTHCAQCAYEVHYAPLMVASCQLPAGHDGGHCFDEDVVRELVEQTRGDTCTLVWAVAEFADLWRKFLRLRSQLRFLTFMFLTMAGVELFDLVMTLTRR